MAQIINDGTSIKYTNRKNETIKIPKEDFSFETSGNNILIYRDSKLVDELKYSEITNLAPLSITDLVLQITAFLETGQDSLAIGAATSALQTEGNASLTTLEAKDFATQTTLALIKTELEAKADLTETQPVKAQGERGAVIEAGTQAITLGGTSQEIFPANATRKYLFIQNLSDENLFVRFGNVATAGSGSIKIKPDLAFIMECNFISNQSVNIISATTGKIFTALQS